MRFRGLLLDMLLIHAVLCRIAVRIAIFCQPTIQKSIATATLTSCTIEDMKPSITLTAKGGGCGVAAVQRFDKI